MLIDIRELIFYLNIERGSVISFVGCGGKTTLIEEMARGLGGRCRVGIAATTRMYLPAKDRFTKLILPDDATPENHILEPGIYYITDEILADGKLHGLSPSMVGWARENMDILLVEADGSAGKPLKGWREDEPVILPETTMTIGVLPVYPLGQAADAQIIHRLDQFSALTGIKPGEIIRNKHYIAMIENDQGLFKNAVGEKVLFFSQVNTTPEEDQANTLVDEGIFDAVEKVVIGCIRGEAR